MLDVPWTKNLKGERAVVVGGGIAGLGAAIALALRGARVTVLERRDVLGGRLGRMQRGGYSWDVGPPLIHYPQAFTHLWSQAGLRFSDFVDLRPVDPLYRAIFADGDAVDVWADAERFRDEVAQFSTADADRLLGFIRRAHAVRADMEKRHFGQPSSTWRAAAPSDPASLASGSYLAFLQRQFRHERTVRILAHAAAPLGFPATTASPLVRFMAAMEWKHECWYPVDGMMGLVSAFARLAELNGVAVATGCEVESVRALQAFGKQVSGSGFAPIDARIVVFACDPGHAIGELLDDAPLVTAPRKRLAARTPSFASYSLFIGAKKRWPALRHRTVFFSPLGIEEEHRMLSQWRTPCSAPTLEVAFPAHIIPEMSPEGGSALRVSCDQPSISDSWRWSDRSAVAVRDGMIHQLEKGGLAGLEKHIEVEAINSPMQERDEYLLPEGSMHGPGFGERMGAIVKAPNRIPELAGLYFAGAGAHPGSLPAFACIGGMHAATCAAKDFGAKAAAPARAAR